MYCNAHDMDMDMDMGLYPCYCYFTAAKKHQQ